MKLYFSQRISISICICILAGQPWFAYSQETGESRITTSASQAGQDSLSDIHPLTGNRLPPVTRDELDDFGKKLYDAYIAEGISFEDTSEDYIGPRGIRINSPRVAEYMTMGNRYLRYDSGIEPRLREMTILIAARAMDNKYEWAAHEHIARDEGLEEEIIDIIRLAKPIPAGLGEKETAILTLGREVLGNHYVNSETYARAVKLFGKKMLLDIVSLMAHYTATAITLTTFNQQLHPKETDSLPQVD